MIEEIFRASDVNIPNDRGHGLKYMNLSIRKAEVLGIFGNRYSGKNKLFHLIMGELEPASGFLSWEGFQAPVSSGVVWLSHDFKLIDELTVWENMLILWGKHEAADGLNIEKLKKMIALLLDDYGITFSIKSKVRDLSPIEKLSIEILAARHQKARILLLDGTGIEGTTVEYRQLKKLLTQMKQEGMSIVYANYQMPQLFFMADRIGILHKGRMIKFFETETTSLEELERSASVLYHEMKPAVRKNKVPENNILFLYNMNAGLCKPVSISVNAGEFAAVISPRLELFSILESRIKYGEQEEGGILSYQGKVLSKVNDNREIYFLNTAYLESLIEELSPLENLCLGMYEKLSFLGVERKNMMRCLEQEFDDWYGQKALLKGKNSARLYRKERIAVNLFRLQLLRPRVIISNDFSIHNDQVTYRMVMNCLADLLDQGTAVCMVTGDTMYNNELVGQYIFLDQDYE